MLIPPPLRLGVVAPRCRVPMRVIRYRIRGFVVLLRVLLLCFHAAAHADKALPPPVRPATDFLDAVALDFANSHPFHAVEGIAPVRESHAIRSDARSEPTPAPAAPAPQVNTLPPAPANFRRVNAP